MVIITQVVQFSNLPAASKGILILNLNSVSRSLCLEREVKDTNPTKKKREKIDDWKQINGNGKHIDIEKKTLQLLKVF